MKCKENRREVCWGVSDFFTDLWIRKVDAGRGNWRKVLGGKELGRMSI